MLGIKDHFLRTGEPLAFNRAGLMRGAQRSLPLALGVFVYGLVFGVLAQQAGLSLVEALLMSGLVFAGASQFVAVGLWATPLPVVTIVVATLIVNLRHLLMSAALSPWFLCLPPPVAYGSLFFLNDESWALTMNELHVGKANGAFLLGSGLVMFVAWLAATVVGRLGGAAVGDPARWGGDFAFTAVFVALLVGQWKGKTDLVPWAVAGLVAVLAERLLGGTWYILLGGLAGSVVGAVRHANR
jgi:4-azaleucine resistance transporter AzlC